MSELPIIGHWIDGKNVAGDHRSQEVWNPATGAAEKRVLLADKRPSTRRSPPQRRRTPRGAPRRRSSARA